MQTLCGFYARRFSTCAGLLLMCALSITACSNSGGGNGGSGGAAATAGAGRATSMPGAAPSSTPQIRLGAQLCPEGVKNPDHWDAIIGTQSGVSRVARVECANLIGLPTLQALILVSYQGTGQVADVYVYKDITSPSPAQLFRLQGLFKGDARVSGYNTLITSEVDQASSLNKGRSNVSMTPDLFREFKWSDGAGTFVPVTFPGIFPDLTRFQAEVAQQQVNSGHEPWRLSALQASRALVANLLKWNGNVQATLVSGGGLHEVNAVVDVKSAAPAGSSVTITFNRLEGNSNGGIWEATTLTSPGLTLTAPQARDLLSSPVAVSGTGGSRVVVLDHLYTDIGHAGVSAAFSTHVAYASTFKNGTQEGLLALYAYSGTGNAIAGAVMLKEMLS
jgi:hypothetical protein